MTKSEQESINKLNQTLSEIKENNLIFKNEIRNLVEKLENKVTEKHIPITLENQIVNSVKDSLHDSIVKSLSSYRSPLQELVSKVIEENSTDIKRVFEKMVKKEIETVDFEKDLEDQFRRKLAKSVIAGVEGVVDKEFNSLKQSPVFRSELTLLINNLIKKFNK